MMKKRTTKTIQKHKTKTNDNKKTHNSDKIERKKHKHDKHENNKELNKEYLKIASKVKQASPLRFKHYDSQQKINKTPILF